jgi:AraC family transcriptional regulator
MPGAKPSGQFGSGSSLLGQHLASVIAGQASLEPHGGERALGPVEILQPVFKALLASYVSAEASAPLEMSFCLPSPAGPCLLTVCLKSPGDGKRLQVRSVKGGLTPRQLRLVLEHMNENLCRQIAMSELSRTAGLSRSHFQRAFKVSTGYAPCAYIAQLRIARAKAMMRETAEPFSQIALACGLSDQSHFSRLFRKVVGATPSQWRHACRT